MTAVSGSLLPLLFYARVSGIVVAVLVLTWCLALKSSFLPHSSSQEDLIYAVLHPLLMVIGFIITSGEAILVHRWLPGSRNLKKSVHLCLQGVALASGIFGIWTKFHGKDGLWLISIVYILGWVYSLSACLMLSHLLRLLHLLLFSFSNAVLAISPYSPLLPVSNADTPNYCASQLLSHFTWPSTHHNNNDDCNGWTIVESPPLQTKTKKGLPIVVVGGAVGSSLALLLAAIGYFSLSRKGFRLQFGSPLNALHDILNLNEIKSGERKNVESVGRNASTDPVSQTVSDDTSETVASGYEDKLERVIISVAIDSTQQEALSVLKKLMIIEDDVKADELCTRRVYARWLVCLNSLLERNPKHRIVPAKSLSGSVLAAFDDVDVEDPDFVSIQALAEAGVIPSKLLGKNCGSDGSKGQGGIYFFSERFLSRQDLINWKAQVEYEFRPDIMEQISRTKLSYMDVKEISSNACLGLFMDMLAGEKSMARRVFGQSKRFQPHKPSTKAQVAVALTSGRMTEAINAELSRLEAERSLREAEMEEIRCELLDRGDIQRFWDEKLNEETFRGVEVEKLYIAARCDLEQELIDQEKSYANDLKEKAAMDCQRQLLLNLKEEVDEMSERLASERAVYVAEKCELQDMLNNLLTKHEGLLDTKSILEAEKEAVRILRSWVEDDARKSQASAKVLQWKWDNHA